MKKTSRKRLTVEREVVRVLVVELAGGQLRHVGGGLPPEETTPEDGCNTSTIVDTTSILRTCRTCQFC